MAATSPVGNVTKMTFKFAQQIDGETVERSIGTGILPFPSATYEKLDTAFRGALNNSSGSGNLIRLTRDTWQDTNLITSISVVEQVAE